MANQYITSDLIAKSAAQNFMVTSPLAYHLANREYENMWENNTYKPGDSVNIRLDNRYRTQRGYTVTPEAMVDRSIPLTIGEYYSVPIQYRPEDLNRDIVSFNDQFIMPAVKTILSDIEADILTNASLNLYNVASLSSGVPTVNDLDTYQKYANVQAYMEEMSLPTNRDWWMVSSPIQKAKIKGALPSLLSPAVTTPILEKGRLEQLDRFGLFTDQGIATQTRGTATSATVASDVAEGATTIALTVGAAETITAGSVLSFTGFNKMNPVNHREVTSQRFTAIVTTTATADGAGAVTVTVNYPIYFNQTGLQNVSGQIVATTAVNILATHKTQIFAAQGALLAAFPKMGRLDTPESSVYTDKDTGISVRVSKGADINNAQNICRLDVQLAYTWLPEMAFQYATTN